MDNNFGKRNHTQEAADFLAALREIPDKDTMQVPGIKQGTFIKVSTLIGYLETGNPLADLYLTRLRRSEQESPEEEDLDKEIANLIENLGRMAEPSNAVVYRSNSGEEVTAAEMMVHLQEKDEIGMDFLERHRQERTKQDAEIERKITLLKLFEDPDETVIVTLEDGQEITVTRLITLLQNKDPLGIEYLEILHRKDVKPKDQPATLPPIEEKTKELSAATRAKNFAVQWLKKLRLM